MVITVIAVALLVGILVSLGSALRHLVREPQGSRKMVKALSWRIGLSVLLFVLLMLGVATGLIEPHGIGG
jgi:predicted anti-sigma-YlaC factor YlaD